MLLVEANPNASKRLAGEWLHPPAVRILHDHGIEFDPQSDYCTVGKGFVVFPDDCSDPIELPYQDRYLGLSCEHTMIVSKLHEAVAKNSNVDFEIGVRVREVKDGRIAYIRNGAIHSVHSERIVGADGRASIVRRSLGLSTSPRTCSRMIGIELHDGSLPLEGYGHLICGGPGPIFMYRLGAHNIRVLVDVPLSYWTRSDWTDLLINSYSSLLPESFRSSFREAMKTRRFYAAANGVKPRISYGISSRVLIGDAAGHYHPMTGVGMTLGFGDAVTLARSRDFDVFAHERFLACRVPEILAMCVYEVFVDHRPEAVAIRHAVYHRWRAHGTTRERTMRLLSCEDKSIFHLTLAVFSTIARVVVMLFPRSVDLSVWHRAYNTGRVLIVRLWWLLHGLQHIGKARNKDDTSSIKAQVFFARSLIVSMTLKYRKKILSSDATDDQSASG